MKKTISKIFCICIILVFLFTNAAYCATGIINGTAVRIRTEASTDSDIVEHLYNGDAVTVYERVGDWYRVSYEGKMGYVFYEYLDVDESEIEVSGVKEEPIDEPEEQEQEQEEVVIEEPEEGIEVNKTYSAKKDFSMKILPLIYSPEICNVKNGDNVKVIQITNNWAYVEANNSNGWILVSNLEITKEVNEDNVLVGYVNVDMANVREGASTRSDILRGATLDTEVQILGEEGDFYYVNISGDLGYISKQLISF